MTNMTNKYYHRFITILLLTEIFFIGCTASDPVLVENDLGNGCSIRLRSFHNWEMSVPIYFDINCIEDNYQYKEVISGPFVYIQPENLQDNVHKLAIIKKNNIIIIQDKSNDDVILALSSLENGFVYPPAKQVGPEYHYQKEKIVLDLKNALNNHALTLQK